MSLNDEYTTTQSIDGSFFIVCPFELKQLRKNKTLHQFAPFLFNLSYPQYLKMQEKKFKGKLENCESFICFRFFEKKEVTDHVKELNKKYKQFKLSNKNLF